MQRMISAFLFQQIQMEKVAKERSGVDDDVAAAIDARAADVLAAGDDDIRLRPTVEDVQRALGLNRQLRQQLVDYQARFECEDLVRLETKLELDSFVVKTIRGVDRWFWPEREFKAEEIDPEAVTLLTQVALGFMLDRVRAGGIAARARGCDVTTRADIVTGDILRGDLDEDDGDAKRARYRKEDAERAVRFSRGADAPKEFSTDILEIMQEERQEIGRADKKAVKKVKAVVEDEEQLVMNCSFVSDVPMLPAEEPEKDVETPTVGRVAGHAA